MSEQKLREWLATLPGHFDGKDSGECLRKAWGAYGGPGSVDEFREALWRYGRKPVQVRAGLFRLALPAVPISSYPQVLARNLGAGATGVQSSLVTDFLIPGAIVRLGAAILSWLPLGLGFIWVLFDSDRLTWHDRLSGTRLVLLPKPNTA